MPGLAQNTTINDQDLADLMTYIRSGWENRASQISESEVARIRVATKDRASGQMYSNDDFKK